MDETKRFLRYALPGLVAVFVYVCAVVLAIPYYRIDLLAIIKSKESGGSIGVAVTAFLSSGALGYLFSTIYFYCSQLWWGIDHKPALIFLIGESKYELIRFISCCGNKDIMNKQEIELMSKEEALAILNSWWWCLQGEDEGALKSDLYLNRLSDILHSLGATIVGISASFALWVLTVICNDSYIEPTNTVIVIICFVFITIISWLNFENLRLYIERYSNSTIVNILVGYLEAEDRKAGKKYYIRE